jgi:hypothetical protein
VNANTGFIVGGFVFGSFDVSLYTSSHKRLVISLVDLAL